MNLSTLQNTLIVSVQAEVSEPLYQPECIFAMAQSVITGGAKALRLASAGHIEYVKRFLPEIPVIGLTKPTHPLSDAHAYVYITPTLLAAETIAQAGAEIVAMDATLRPRPDGETLEHIVERMRERFPNTLLMADIATETEAIEAVRLGFDIVGTTLSGYTTETLDQKVGPNFELLQRLTASLDTPVILEGRVWQPTDVSKAFDLGAFAVVVGSAITRPHLITQRFAQAVPTLKAI